MNSGSAWIWAYFLFSASSVLASRDSTPLCSSLESSLFVVLTLLHLYRYVLFFQGSSSAIRFLWLIRSFFGLYCILSKLSENNLLFFLRSENLLLLKRCLEFKLIKWELPIVVGSILLDWWVLWKLLLLLLIKFIETPSNHLWLLNYFLAARLWSRLRWLSEGWLLLDYWLCGHLTYWSWNR